MSDFNDGKAYGQSHVEELGTPKKPGFGARLKAHYKKYWWLHLIIFIICALVIILPLIYVGFPNIAQDGINDSSLEIQSIKLTDPTPNSFHLEQTAIVGSNNSYHPRLDAFNASLGLDGTNLPFAYIELPAIHATKEATSYVNQTVRIVNSDAFEDYNMQVLGSKNYKVQVKGKTKLHEMRFPTTTVDYNKKATMKGLNKLQGFNVTQFSIKLIPDSDGTNMEGTVYIPNPSAMTISMGNVTFNNFIHGTQTLIGNSTLTDLVLKPGNNTVPMKSIVNQTLVITELTSNFQNGMLPIDVVGLSSVYNGQHLPYFEKALASNTQSITLDVGSALAKIGLDISSGIGL